MAADDLVLFFTRPHQQWCWGCRIQVSLSSTRIYSLSVSRNCQYIYYVSWKTTKSGLWWWRKTHILCILRLMDLWCIFVWIWGKIWWQIKKEIIWFGDEISVVGNGFFCECFGFNIFVSISFNVILYFVTETLLIKISFFHFMFGESQQR